MDKSVHQTEYSAFQLPKFVDDEFAFVSAIKPMSVSLFARIKFLSVTLTIVSVDVAIVVDAMRFVPGSAEEVDVAIEKIIAGA